jgi:tetratricopeptide (TPR) repeat protein
MSESQSERAEQDDPSEVTLGVPSWILLALLALTPALFASGFSSFETLKQIVFVGGMGLALAVWGVQVVRSRAVSLGAGRVTILALTFALFALMATLWADNPLAGLWAALHFVSLAGVVLIVSAPIGRPLRFLDFAVAAGVGAGVSGLWGILDLAGLGVFTVVWDPPGATGGFDAMEFAMAYYVVALPILLGATFRFSGRVRWLFVSCFLLAGFHFALVSGWTMAMVFGAVCLLVLGVVVAYQRGEAVLVLKPVAVMLGVIAVFMAFTQWAWPPPQSANEATSLPILSELKADHDAYRADGQLRNPAFAPDRTESVRTSRAHSYLWEVGTDLFADQPLVGHGAGAWWPLQTSRVAVDHPFVAKMFDHYPAFRSPHNGGLKLLVEYGAAGTALFVLWLIAAFSVSLGVLAGRRERVEWIVEHWALLTAGLIGLVFSLFTPLIELAPSALLWVAALALMARLSAAIDGFRGWGARWSSGASEGGVINTANASAAIAVLVGLAMLTSGALSFMAGYHRGQADHFMLRTAYEQAIDAYKEAGRWNPASGEVALNIGIAATRTGRSSDAERFLEQAVERRPFDLRALTLAGQRELGHRNIEEARSFARRAVQAYPNSVEARQLLVAVLDVKGNYEEAANEAIALLDRQPPRAQRARLHMIVGDLYFDMLQRLTEAKRHYEQAYELIEEPQKRARLRTKIDRVEDMIEEERRLREGKPPRQPPPGDHHGHPH